MTEQPKNEPENYDSSQIQKLEGLEVRPGMGCMRPYDGPLSAFDSLVKPDVDKRLGRTDAE